MNNTLVLNIERLNNAVKMIHNQILEQNTVIREMTGTIDELKKKVQYLESNVTIAEFKYETEHDNEPAENCELTLIE